MAETLILVPGLLCDEVVWAQQRAALAERVDVHVAHHGLLDSLGAMAQRIIDQAPSRFAIAGHSMGGRVALEVVRRVPDRVIALALLDTGATPLAPGEAGEREASGRYALLEASRRQGMRAMAWIWLQNMVHPSRLSDSALTEPILEMMARKTPDIFAAQIQALLSRPDARDVLPKIRCPALLLCGNEDAWAPVKQHGDMASVIPRSKLIVVPECGHMSPMERPEAVTEAFREWLDTVSHAEATVQAGDGR
jgi:pimeloyl-ACP methyl ester carboxylesterase